MIQLPRFGVRTEKQKTCLVFNKQKSNKSASIDVSDDKHKTTVNFATKR